VLKAIFSYHNVVIKILFFYGGYNFLEKNDDDKILDIEFNEAELKDQMLTLDKKRVRACSVFFLFCFFVSFSFFVLLYLKNIIFSFNSFFNILFLIFTIFYFINIIVFFVYIYKNERVENCLLLSKEQIFPELSKNKDILNFKEKFNDASYFERFIISLKYEIICNNIQLNNIRATYINIMQKISIIHLFLSLLIILIVFLKIYL
jgi:magnesium-transporting ATPase (P-type)